MVHGRRRFGLAQALLLAACTSSGPATPVEPRALPTEVEAVRKYILETEYPELFGDEPYRTRIERALVSDLDGDGVAEVILLFYPHYRQSAPIVIYHVSQDMKVTRVMEGLAPGPLQPLSGEYLDSHALGEAVDASVAGPGKQAPLIDAAVTTTGLAGLVEYWTFVHMDGRKGEPFYVDMTDVDVPDGKRSCADFEFSRVEDIAAGGLDGEPGEVDLAARVGSELWLYRIPRFLPDGRLEKQVRVIPIPADFADFEQGQSMLRYRDSSGELHPLRP